MHLIHKLVTLKALLRTLMLPPGGLLLLAALGALLAARRHRGGWALLAASLALLWALSTQLVADRLTRFSEHYPALDTVSAADLGRLSRAQAIVILGGPGDRFVAPEYGGDAAIEQDLLERVNYGAYLAHRTSLPILVTSAWENAFAMRTSLQRDFGIQPRWVEFHARDTFENARNSAAMLLPGGTHTILLVTSSTHMLRSTREFEAAGFTVIPAPIGLSQGRYERPPFNLIPDSDSLMRSQRALYELAGEPLRELMSALHIRRQQPPPSLASQ